VIYDNSKVLESYNFIHSSIFALDRTNVRSNLKILGIKDSKIVLIPTKNITCLGKLKKCFGKGELAKTSFTLQSIANHILTHVESLNDYTAEAKIRIGQIAIRTLLYNGDRRLYDEMTKFGFVPGITYRDEYFMLAREMKVIEPISLARLFENLSPNAFTSEDNINSLRQKWQQMQGEDKK